jgi:hypothetical protein
MLEYSQFLREFAAQIEAESARLAKSDPEAAEALIEPYRAASMRLADAALMLID